jgi:hypothetical protein
VHILNFIIQTYKLFFFFIASSSSSFHSSFSFWPLFLAFSNNSLMPLLVVFILFDSFFSDFFLFSDFLTALLTVWVC